MDVPVFDGVTYLAREAERQRILSLLDSEEMVGPAWSVVVDLEYRVLSIEDLRKVLDAALQSIREELAKS